MRQVHHDYGAVAAMAVCATDWAPASTPTAAYDALRDVYEAFCASRNAALGCLADGAVPSPRDAYLLAFVCAADVTAQRYLGGAGVLPVPSSRYGWHPPAWCGVGEDACGD